LSYNASIIYLDPRLVLGIVRMMMMMMRRRRRRRRTVEI
jgi:hypothetical protein